jgi:hypothetical protein
MQGECSMIKSEVTITLIGPANMCHKTFSTVRKVGTEDMYSYEESTK